MAEHNSKDNMIGRRFGRLTVLRLDEDVTQKNKNHAKSYICQCDCGNVKTIRRANLLSGSSTSCGCFLRDFNKDNNSKKVKDLIGQRFGKLTVTKKKENDPNDPIKTHRKDVWWYADCDCGTKDVIVRGTYLRAGRVKSCGCYNAEASHNKNMIDLTGQKYGMLTVVSEATDIDRSQRKSRSVLWRCICDCGNETVVSTNALRTGGTVSCGCLSSKHEKIIKDHLTKLGVKYKTQFWFDDLRSPITNWVLKFDFAVFGNNNNLVLLIEYDGEQHESGTRFSPSDEENKEKFKRTKLYDKMKDDYCSEHNIDLLRISYKHKDQLLTLIDNKLK